MEPSRLQLAPGLGLTLLLAVLAGYIHTLPFAPFTIGTRHPVDTILVAIALGIALRNLVPLPRWLGFGIKYSVLSLLPAAIVLMGAKLDFQDVARVSAQALLIAVICVSAAMAVTLWLCRRRGVDQKLGILVAIGTAICGGTAIAVTAPIIEADENQTAFAVATITLIGLLSIVVFPLAGGAMELSQIEFGVWAGTAIHATPQVMAAGFAYGDQAGEIATVVKLVRVLLLAPLVMGVGIWYGRQKRRQEQAHVAPQTKLTTLFPPFIFGFVLMALANSLHLLPDFTMHLEDSPLWRAGTRRVAMSDAVTTLSGFLVTMSMAGVGLGTDLRAIRKTGPQALYVGLFASVVLALSSLALLRALL